MLPLGPVLKDLAVAVNEVYYSVLNEPLSNFNSYLALQTTLFFIINCIKESFVYIVTFQWLSNLSYLPNLIPEIQHSVLNETYVTNDPFSTLFTFLEVPAFGNPKIFLGFFNSFFLVLPLSVGHLLTVRRVLLYGILPGLFSVGGTILGQLCFVTSVLFGLRFIVIPWFSNPFLHFFLVLLVIYSFVFDETLSDKAFNFKKQKEQSTLTSFFLDNFILSWAEQVSLFQFFQNLTFGPQPTALESFSANDGLSFAVETFGYIAGLAFGSLFFASVFGWALISFRNWIYSVAPFSFARVFKTLNNLSALTIHVFLFSSNPLIFYGFDYLTANQLGFLPQSFTSVQRPLGILPISLDESTYLRKVRRPLRRQRSPIRRIPLLHTRNKIMSSFDTFPAPALVSKSTPRYYPFDQRMDQEFAKVMKFYPNEFDSNRSSLLDRRLRNIKKAEMAEKNKREKARQLRKKQGRKSYRKSPLQIWDERYHKGLKLVKISKKRIRKRNKPTSNKFWLQHDLLYDLPRLNSLKPKKSEKDFKGLTKKLKILTSSNASSLNPSSVNKFFSKIYNYTNRERAFSLSDPLEEKKDRSLYQRLKELRKNKKYARRRQRMRHTLKAGSEKSRSRITSRIYKQLKNPEVREQPPLDRLATEVFFYKGAEYSFGQYRGLLPRYRILQEKVYLYELKKSPLWKIMRRVSFDSDYLNQPTFQKLKSGEEHRLFIKRQILGSFYEGFRYHKKMPGLEQFQLDNKNLKSEALKVFNHQFKGHKFYTKQRFETTFKPRQFLTFLKATTIKPRYLNPVFKYDQPLFLDKKLTGYKKYSPFHEELQHQSQLDRKISYKEKKQPDSYYQSLKRFFAGKEKKQPDSHYQLLERFFAGKEKKQPDSQLPKRFLEISNSTPFFAGVEPNSGKLVISNQLYPRLKAGYLLGHQPNGRLTTFIKSKIKGFPSSEMKKSPKSFYSWSIMNNDFSHFFSNFSNRKKMRSNKKMKKSRKKSLFTLWPVNEALINRKTKSNLLNRTDVTDVRDENALLSKPKQSFFTYDNNKEKSHPLSFPDFDPSKKEKAASLPAKSKRKYKSYLNKVGSYLNLVGKKTKNEEKIRLFAQTKKEKEKKQDEKNNLFATLKSEPYKVKVKGKVPVRKKGPKIIAKFKKRALIFSGWSLLIKHRSNRFELYNEICLKNNDYFKALDSKKKRNSSRGLKGLKGRILEGLRKLTNNPKTETKGWLSFPTNKTLKTPSSPNTEKPSQTLAQTNTTLSSSNPWPSSYNPWPFSSSRLSTIPEEDEEEEEERRRIANEEDEAVEVNRELGIQEGYRRLINDVLEDPQENDEITNAVETNREFLSKLEELERVIEEDERVRKQEAIINTFNTDLHNLLSNAIKPLSEYPTPQKELRDRLNEQIDRLMQGAHLRVLDNILVKADPNWSPIQSIILYNKAVETKKQKLILDKRIREVRGEIQNFKFNSAFHSAFIRLLKLNPEWPYTAEQNEQIIRVVRGAQIRILHEMFVKVDPTWRPIDTYLIYNNTVRFDLNNNREILKQLIQQKRIIKESGDITNLKLHHLIQSSLSSIFKPLFNSPDYQTNQKEKEREKEFRGIFLRQLHLGILHETLVKANPNWSPDQTVQLYAKAVRANSQIDDIFIKEQERLIKEEKELKLINKQEIKALTLRGLSLRFKVSEPEIKNWNFINALSSKILSILDPLLDRFSFEDQVSKNELRSRIGVQAQLSIINAIIQKADPTYGTPQHSTRLNTFQSYAVYFQAVKAQKRILNTLEAEELERREEELERREEELKLKNEREKKVVRGLSLRFKVSEPDITNWNFNYALSSKILSILDPLLDRFSFEDQVDKNELRSRIGVQAQLSIINAVIQKADPTYGTPQHSTRLNTFQSYAVYFQAVKAQKRILNTLEAEELERIIERKRRIKKFIETPSVGLSVEFHFNLFNNDQVRALEKKLGYEKKRKILPIPPQLPSIIYKVLKKEKRQALPQLPTKGPLSYFDKYKDKVLEKEKRQALPQLPTKGPLSYFTTVFTEPYINKDEQHVHVKYCKIEFAKYLRRRRTLRKRRRLYPRMFKRYKMLGIRRASKSKSVPVVILQPGKIPKRGRTRGYFHFHPDTRRALRKKDPPFNENLRTIRRWNYDIQKKRRGASRKVSTNKPPFLSRKLNFYPLFHSLSPDINHTGRAQYLSFLKEPKRKMKTQKRETKKHRAVTDVTSKATIKNKQRGKKPKTKEKSEKKRIKTPMKKRIQLRAKEIKNRFRRLGRVANKFQKIELYAVIKILKSIAKRKTNVVIYRTTKLRKEKLRGRRRNRAAKRKYALKRKLFVRDQTYFYRIKRSNRHENNMKRLDHIRRLKVMKQQNRAVRMGGQRRFKQSISNSILPSNKNTRNWPGFLPARYELLTKDPTDHDLQRGRQLRRWLYFWSYHQDSHYVEPSLSFVKRYFVF